MKLLTTFNAKEGQWLLTDEGLCTLTQVILNYYRHFKGESNIVYKKYRSHYCTTCLRPSGTPYEKYILNWYETLYYKILWWIKYYTK